MVTYLIELSTLGRSFNNHRQQSNCTNERGHQHLCNKDIKKMIGRMTSQGVSLSRR